MLHVAALKPMPYPLMSPSYAPHTPPEYLNTIQDEQSTKMNSQDEQSTKIMPGSTLCLTIILYKELQHTGLFVLLEDSSAGLGAVYLLLTGCYNNWVFLFNFVNDGLTKTGD